MIATAPNPPEGGKRQFDARDMKEFTEGLVNLPKNFTWALDNSELTDNYDPATKPILYEGSWQTEKSQAVSVTVSNGNIHIKVNEPGTDELQLN